MNQREDLQRLRRPLSSEKNFLTEIQSSDRNRILYLEEQLAKLGAQTYSIDVAIRALDDENQQASDEINATLKEGNMKVADLTKKEVTEIVSGTYLTKLLNPQFR